MSAPEHADDRLKILLDQLDAVWEMLDARLTERKPFQSASGSTAPTLTDEEFFWEPAPGCWSIRRRVDARTSRAHGSGEWVMDHESPEPQPPLTTIAWRLGHIALWQLMRYDYTFGDRSLRIDDIAWPSTAHDAVRFIETSYQQWRTALEGLTSADLDTIGRSQMPYGLDPNVRFVDLLAWTNTELAHHAAEVGLLRDLYRAQYISR
jgi:hypothetical protein